MPEDTRVVAKPGADAARGRRGQRPDDRGRLPDGRLRRRPDRDQGRAWTTSPPSPTTSARRSSASATPTTRAWRAACRVQGPVDGRADARQGGQRRRSSQHRALHVRPLDRARRRDRQRDRGRDRRRPRCAAATRTCQIDLSPRSRTTSTTAWASPPDLRPLGDAGALPEPRRLVRGARDHDLAEHARAAASTATHARGRARHRRAARRTTG